MGKRERMIPAGAAGPTDLLLSNERLCPATPRPGCVPQGKRSVDRARQFRIPRRGLPPYISRVSISPTSLRLTGNRCVQGETRGASRRAFTLLEVLVAVGLMATLLGLIGAMLDGGRRLVRFGEEQTMRSRQVELCLMLLRKELEEIRIDSADPRCFLEAGAGFLAYATTRAELIARNDVPRGLVRVLWQYDPDRRSLHRTVVPVSAAGAEALPERESWFLEDLASFEVRVRTEGRWQIQEGRPTAVSDARAIGVSFAFGGERTPFWRIQSAFPLVRP